MSTKPPAVHLRHHTKTRCGRVLGLMLKGGDVFLNGSQRVVVTDDPAATTCGGCLTRLQRVAP